MLLAAVGGTISPVTNGFGVSLLQHSPWATWAPVGVLPLLVVLVRLLAFSLVALRQETEREESRRKRERKRPGLHKVLVRARTERSELNSQLELDSSLPDLNAFAFTHDILVEVTGLIRTQYDIPDAGIALMHESDDEGFIVDVHHNIEDRVKARLELGAGIVTRTEAEEALEESLRPLQYRNALEVFGAGPKRYLLVIISGATIPDDARAEISDTATFLVEEYTWAVRKPERRKKADEAGR